MNAAGAGVIAAALIGAAAPACRGRQSPAQDASAPVTVDNSEVHVLPRAANGRDYQLMVQTPPGYAAHPEQRYPVIYVLDGYWDFKLFASIVGGHVYDKAMPEAIIVGLGYPGTVDYGRMRKYDLTPVPDTRPDAGGQNESGHAHEFFGVIESQIIPFVEGRYRADPTFRVLAGSSWGGLFALYVLFSKPALFAAYIAPSPAVSYGNDWLFGHEEQFARSGGKPTARLYMTVAEEEWPDRIAAIKRFDARLRERAGVYQGLAYQFRVIDGERHGGTKPESYNRGVRFAFAPRAPAP